MFDKSLSRLVATKIKGLLLANIEWRIKYYGVSLVSALITRVIYKNEEIPILSQYSR